MQENESFEVLVPLRNSPPLHLPWDVYDELTWVIKIPQKWSPIMPLFFAVNKEWQQGIGWDERLKGVSY